MKLIKINTDHYVVVDDSEIKEGDYFLSGNNNILHYAKGYTPEDTNDRGLNCKKITHSTTTANLDVYGQTPIGLSLSEVKELIGEVDVEDKAKEEYPSIIGTTQTGIGYDMNSREKEAYKKGYNQALEDNKEKKYTEEDLGLFLEYVRDNYTGMGAPHLVHNKGGQRKTKAIVQDYIQSLQPKTEWEVQINFDGKLKLKL